MDITWESVASVATPLGLIATVYQLHQARRALRDTFERSFVDRYQRIASQIELDVLLGARIADLTDRVVQRAFYDYFELCEEELYFRAHRKIDSGTWRDWWYGMALNLRNPSFEQAFDELIEPSDPRLGNPVPDRFPHLRIAFDHRSASAAHEPERIRPRPVVTVLGP